MVRCPACRAAHPQNTLFCDQCGAKLPATGPANGTVEIGAEARLSQTPIPPAENPPNPSRIIFLLAGQERDLPLPLRERVILGRGGLPRGQAPSGERGQATQLDFSSFRAYDLGVSRQHAALFQQGETLLLEE